MRAFLAALVLATACLTGGTSIATASNTSSYCGIAWGSLPKISGDLSTSKIVDVRSGRHDCFDRLVVDMHSRGAGWRVEYVPAVHADGSGQFVPLRGGAFLQFVVLAPAYDLDGGLTYQPAYRSELVDVRGYATFRQVAYAGSFEGQTTFGLGVRARLPFRVFYLDGPGSGSRIVLDVAHQWQ